MSMTQDLAAELQQERFALSSLLDFARTLTPDLGPRGIVRSVLRTVMGKSLIKEAFAYVGTNETGYFELAAHAGFAGFPLHERIDSEQLDKMLSGGPKNAVLVPLVGADGAGYLGLLALGPSINPNLSGESEATYLASLAALTSIALTNAMLFDREKQTAAERERMESELRLAREIQFSLLPQKLPHLEGVEIAAVSRPSEWVGGDYYDVIDLGAQRILICVADVVGKGIGAALTMSNMQAALRALAAIMREGHLTLIEVVTKLNRLMTESTAPERFITAAFAILDAKHHKIETVIAGHPNPVMSGAKQTVLMESTGIPLGIVGNFEYEARTYDVPTSAVILFFTDGLSEARYQGSFVGAAGVQEVLDHPEIRTGDLKAALERLVASPNLTIEDDITVLALRIG
jgi:phosphoserine phosphatase RsbU/P